MLQTHLNNYSFGPRIGSRRRRRRNGGKPEQRRNIPSAFFSLVAAGLYAVSMAEPNWLKIDSGRCAKEHIGLYKVFGSLRKPIADMNRLYCMNSHAVLKLRIVATLCFCAVFACLLQFALDTCGTKRKGFAFMRRNSVCNIFAIFITIVTMGLTYWVTHDIQKADTTTTTSVHFAAAFYILLAACGVALFSVTLNLLQCTCERRTQEVNSDIGLELIYNELAPDESLPPMPPPVYEP